eukprot:jgi/Psemu1/285541/fgenesh1_pg.93_\
MRPSTCLPKNWVTVPILGPHATRVLLESVTDLRNHSRELCSTDVETMDAESPGVSSPGNLQQELIVRRGETVPILLEVLGELVKHDEARNGTNGCGFEHEREHQYEYQYELCWNEEPGWYERKLSEAVRAAVSERYGDSVRLRTALSCTLYHPEDLPAAGSWQPLSKKEKRRLENQRKRQRQLAKKSQPRNQSPPPSSTPSGKKGDDRYGNNPRLDGGNAHEWTHISPDRWDGMPKIMGDFRRIARERAGIRPSRNNRRSSSSSSSIQSSRKKANCNAKEPNVIVDPGSMPTLESLLEPLLRYVGENDDNADNETAQKRRKPVLGLPPSVIRNVCHHAIRIHRENCNEVMNATIAGASTPSSSSSSSSTTTIATASNAASKMPGGERTGLAHLSDFCQNHSYTARRNLACVDQHQSSHIGQYLAFGCLSPRVVVEVAQAFIDQKNTNPPRNGSKGNDQTKKQGDTHENDGTWLISHMTMRDFFLYTCLASGNQFYRLEGIPVNHKNAASMEWKPFVTRTDEYREQTNEDTAALDLWEAWATGNTGLPLVDACMRELIETGYASNRVRQNAASVLAKDLRLDWRAGAEWFQFLLSDHCVAANWGNWLYFSGVGPDPKQRHFCTVSQAAKYDPDGTYVRKWLPELRDGSSESPGADVSDREFHLRPWDFDASWRKPVVDPASQYTWRDLERLKETGKVSET